MKHERHYEVKEGTSMKRKSQVKKAEALAATVLLDKSSSR